MIMTGEAGTSLQTTLKVRLLGPPETIWAEEQLEISRRQPRAILYRLATQPEPVPRAQLCLLFWPEVTESEARRHLSNQVYNLRRALPDPELIQTPNDQLVLDSERIWSDVAVFEHLSQSSERKELQQAVDLYRGPFLDGFSVAEDGEFSLWADRERRGLERRYLETLSALTRLYSTHGEHEAAIACAQRYLEVDDLAEDMHRRLIDLYAAQGDRSAALRQYECCAAILERELGVDPLPETREVYQAVLKDRIAPARTAHPRFTWRTLPSLEAPLVGRNEAMAQLRAAFSQTREGRGTAVLISGEAGVGKSRLLEEFLSQYAGEARLIIGSGYQAQGEVPYLSLVEALRPLLPKVDWETLEVDPSHMGQLLPLLPELREHIPDLAEPSSTEQGQVISPVFRGLAHLVFCLARQQPPLILCLDDLHWTDETTRSWVSYLSTRLGEAPVMLLGGYRTEEAESLELLRAGLARRNVLEEVKLQGLLEPEVGHLIQRLSGQKSSYGEFRRRLHRLTGGNPFFLLETLHALFEAGLLQGDETGWRVDLDQLNASLDELFWPDSLTETVLRRVGRLHPTTVQVLQAGAVIGQRFNLILVLVTSGRSEREVVTGLDELADHQLIVPGEERYQFKHDLIRAIVYTDMSYGRRKLLHRRAGEALEELAPDHAAALARHFAEAGETEKAADYWLLAGDQARGLFAHKEAVEFYQRALSFQEANGALEAAARTHMHLGLSHQIAYDYPRARQAYEKSFSMRKQAIASQPEDLPPAHRPLRLFWFSAPNPQRLSAYDHSRLDPGNQRTSELLIKQLYSGLVRSGADWTIQPEVARAWEISDDGCRYIFHIRDDAIWTDGEPVTADDFAFAWKRLLKPKTGKYSSEKVHAYPLYTIKGALAYQREETRDPDSVGVRALDPLTLEVELEEPASYFLNLLNHYPMSPVPRHVVERYGENWTEPGYIVTNGPFCIQEWLSGEKVTLARNPTYCGVFKGNLSRVNISNQMLSPADQLEAYRAGRVDILSLGLETYPARFQHAEEYHQAHRSVTYLLGFGRMESPFHDRRVRQAFTLAIDKDDFGKQTTPGFDTPATGGFLPPGFPGHSPGIGLSQDLKRARRLLAEAGYPGGKGFPDVELLTIRARLKYAQALQRVWDQHLDIQVSVNAMERKDFFKHFWGAPLFIIGWWANYPAPGIYLRVGAQSLAGEWKHQGYDGLIQKAIRIRDEAERLGLYRQADRLLMEAAAVVPLFYRADHYLVKPWLKMPLQNFSLKDAILEPR